MKRRNREGAGGEREGEMGEKKSVESLQWREHENIPHSLGKSKSIADTVQLITNVPGADATSATTTTSLPHQFAIYVMYFQLTHNWLFMENWQLMTNCAQQSINLLPVWPVCERCARSIVSVLSRGAQSRTHSMFGRCLWSRNECGSHRSFRDNHLHHHHQLNNVYGTFQNEWRCTHTRAPNDFEGNVRRWR